MLDNKYRIQIIKLSPREVDVLTLAAQGKMRREIAEMLFLSDVTVKEYLQSACQKLGATNKTQATVLALLLGLIAPYRPHGLAQNPVILRKKIKKSPRMEGAKKFRETLSQETTSTGFFDAR